TDYCIGPASPARSAGGPNGARGADVLLAVLQFADGLFPSGGFAHSFGLETYAQTGAIRDASGVGEFLRAQLEGSTGPADAVAAACAVRRARETDLAGSVEIDQRLDAMKWVPEFRAGSLKIGIGGPVGSGKTALTEALCLRLRERVDMAVITNDIYTKEDAEFLTRRGALPAERVVGVETGGCPHTAIREDASVNLEAIRG